MTPRRVTFIHDGHRFEATEQISNSSESGAPSDAVYTWTVRMDDAPALEFHGAFPYRDDDVKKRVVEWYGIQKPRG